MPKQKGKARARKRAAGSVANRRVSPRVAAAAASAPSSSLGDDEEALLDMPVHVQVTAGASSDDEPLSFVAASQSALHLLIDWR